MLVSDNCQGPKAFRVLQLEGLGRPPPQVIALHFSSHPSLLPLPQPQHATRLTPPSFLEGVVIFSLDHTLLFDPLELDVDVTPHNILAALHKKEYLKSLVVCIVNK